MAHTNRRNTDWLSWIALLISLVALFFTLFTYQSVATLHAEVQSILPGDLSLDTQNVNQTVSRRLNQLSDQFENTEVLDNLGQRLDDVRIELDEDLGGNGDNATWDQINSQLQDIINSAQENGQQALNDLQALIQNLEAEVTNE